MNFDKDEKVIDLGAELYNAVDEYLNNGEEPDTIKHRLQIALETGVKSGSFSTDELMWLRYQVNAIPKIIGNQICAGIYYLLYTNLGMHIRLMGRRMGKYNSVISHWLRKMEKLGLIQSHTSLKGWGSERTYYIKKKIYPTITKMIFDKIQMSHGTDNLKKITSINKEVQGK